MHIKNRIITSLILSLVLLFSTDIVFAHRVYLFAYRDGNTVYTESYFGKTKVKGGEIKVYDLPSGKLLLKGKTDDKGLFSFKMEPERGIRIVLIASMGHRAEFVLKGLKEVESKSKKTSVVKEKVKSSTLKESPCVEMDEIKQVMESVLDSRLKSIHDRLTQIQEEKGPGFTEIIGGIGYIFGLMGIVLYFKSKKK